eukprot:5623279-Prymnesium_polylepis.2
MHVSTVLTGSGHPCCHTYRHAHLRRRSSALKEQLVATLATQPGGSTGGEGGFAGGGGKGDGDGSKGNGGGDDGGGGGCEGGRGGGQDGGHGGGA